MTEQHSITPPPELVRQWMRVNNMDIAPFHLAQALAAQAARWGADQELEACCEWLDQNTGRWDLLAELRAARRPKPPSLKEQALEELDKWREVIGVPQLDTIRRALEQLPE